MAEQSRKVVLPAYLIRRCEAFRIVKGDETSYVVRDKLHGRTHDFDPWQFFILEVLPGCESVEKLQSVFRDRFDRTVSKQELDVFFASLADRKLLDETALQHPLLVSFARKTYEVVDGKAVPKQHSAAVALVGGTDLAAPAPPEPGGAAKPEAAAPDKVLPAGIEDVIGLDAKTGRRIIDLFDPRPILRVITPIVAPLRYLAFALPVLLVVSLILATRNWALLTGDLRTLHVEMSLFEHLIFVMFTVNLVTTISTACVAHAFGASVERIGLTLYVGFIPRFVPRIQGTDRLSRRERMWLHGSNLIMRATMLCAGVLLWYNTRNLAGSLHEVGLVFVLTCWGSLLLETGNPLVRGSAYFLLAAFLNEPHLRGKSFKALMNKLHGGVYRAADSTVLALYALASLTYVVVLVLFLAAGFNEWLMRELRLGGLALAITAALVAFLFWRNYVGLRKYAATYERTVQFDRWRTRTLVAEDEAEAAEVPAVRPKYWRRALLLLLLLVLFIPYPYDASGTFSIYPLRKQVMSTDTPGLVEEVFYDGGESVKKGTVLARLAHDDYTAQIKVLDAKIVEQQAVVDDLKTRPKPEEVKVAEEALAVARTREGFSRDKVPRLEKLYNAGAVSFEELDSARKDHDTDVQQVAEKLAALELVKAGVTADQIAAAEAKLVSLKEERATYEGKIERMTLKMPFDGNILTLHLKDRTNSYLDRGQMFAAIEYTGEVTAEVEVTESDLQYVNIGSAVRARPYSYFNREFEGKVTQIDRNVTNKPVGSVVKVIATFENKDEALKSGMTGQAKIDGPTMPLWEAFSQALVRFVRVQVWSWIP